MSFDEPPPAYNADITREDPTLWGEGREADPDLEAKRQKAKEQYDRRQAQRLQEKEQRKNQKIELQVNTTTAGGGELPPSYEQLMAQVTATNNGPRKGMGCLAGMMATGHYKAWFFTLWLIFFVVSYIMCAIDIDEICSCDCFWYRDGNCVESDYTTCDRDDTVCGFPCDMTFQLGAWFWVIFGVAYVMYFYEVWCCSSSRRYLANAHESQTAAKYIEDIQKNEPKIILKVECYHYESNSDGGDEKKVTHRASKTYNYTAWKDVSPKIEGLDEWNLTKLKNYKTFSFANGATESNYRSVVRQFKRANNKDKYQSFWVITEIPGFEKFILVESHPGAKSCCISLNLYLLFSFLGCTTCYRMYFSSVCGRKEYVFNKQISI